MIHLTLANIALLIAMGILLMMTITSVFDPPENLGEVRWEVWAIDGFWFLAAGLLHATGW